VEARGRAQTGGDHKFLPSLPRRRGAWPNREPAIREFHPEESQYELDDLDDKEVAFLTDQKRITPAMEQAFRRILDQKNKVDDLDSQIGTRKTEVDGITKDQARVRENMKALKGSSEEKALIQRYTHQLDTQEDRLAALNSQISDLESKKDSEEEKLSQIVEQVTLDETF
jgi:chromosome segregation ATPase